MYVEDMFKVLHKFNKEYQPRMFAYVTRNCSGSDRLFVKHEELGETSSGIFAIERDLKRMSSMFIEKEMLEEERVFDGVHYKTRNLLNWNTVHKIKSVSESEITFSNGWKLEYEHEQDCCEHHYLDFKTSGNELVGESVNLAGELFERVEDYGIRLIVENNFPIPIAGYGYNNGYYSDEIKLKLLDEKGNTVRLFDITECQSIY